jgi:type I site-specific restriction-modification system R (restriction) subunit
VFKFHPNRNQNRSPTRRRDANTQKVSQVRFNQINCYGRDSFWAGSGLFDYVQLFVISNGTLTKYCSNTTRRQHIREAAGSKKAKKTSNSFEFTSWRADATNELAVHHHLQLLRGKAARRFRREAHANPEVSRK